MMARPHLSLGDATVFVLVALILAAAVFGNLLAPEATFSSDIGNAFLPPDAQHWLGTDSQGRDVLWRVIAGAAPSLLSSMLVVTIYSLIGVVVATLATVVPRWLDEGLMRGTEIGLALPGVIVAMGFASAMGPSLASAVIAMSITGWPITARLLRSITRQTMVAPYVQGAQVMGVSRFRLMTRHVLPNSLDVLIIKWSGDVSITILVLGGLSFVGVGAQPPSAEWGAMISDARSYVSTAWWTAAAPGAAIALTAVSFSLLGDILQRRLGGAGASGGARS
ncbi:ABC transporter permease [Mesorhizobium sp. BR1-1-16]|uniref:ABC transporter permease n=1 Tax=Mesorhizobium sp. BR1-1-16 TaxID=2876653 RepID=UPI001CCB9F98|nr:ABC transporter permease [Mesorhizobium sp. BR1-1-16]MBZ9939411.1 ABC transporter permease [Mesorhizobium sp. BR1-1-16]